MRSKLAAIAIMFLITLPAGARCEEQEMVLQADQDHVVRPVAANQNVHNENKQDSFYGFDSAKPGVVAAGKKVKDDKPAKSAVEIYGDIDLPPTKPEDASGGQVAMPVITQKAVMSRSDENWIMCSEPIKEVLKDDDAHIDVKYFGTSAFIKFQYLTDADKQKIIYPAPRPVSLHIPCGDAIYSIIAVPVNIQSQTIRLGNEGKVTRIKDNATLFHEQDTRKRVQELIRRAYADDIPDSFEVKTINKPLAILRDVSCVFHRTISVPGEGMVLKEYYLTPNVDGIEFTPKQFIRKEFSAVPVPVAVIPAKPAKGERARLFLVEFSALNEVKGGQDVE